MVGLPEFGWLDAAGPGTSSSLKGNHVWDSLAGYGRAAFSGRLSGEYLRTLLAKVPRILTLKEIGQQFYKNAAFPLVPSSEDVRGAIFTTLSGPDLDCWVRAREHVASNHGSNHRDKTGT